MHLVDCFVRQSPMITPRNHDRGEILLRYGHAGSILYAHPWWKVAPESGPRGILPFAAEIRGKCDICFRSLEGGHTHSLDGRWMCKGEGYWFSSKTKTRMRGRDRRFLRGGLYTIFTFAPTRAHGPGSWRAHLALIPLFRTGHWLEYEASEVRERGKLFLPRSHTSWLGGSPLVSGTTLIDRGPVFLL